MKLLRHARLLVERLLRVQITNLQHLFPYREPRPTDVSNVEILADPGFRDAVNTALPYTFLDTARLANLWQMAQSSNPAGCAVEVGSYRGGSALVIGRAVPDRTVYVCDSFQGFGEQVIDRRLDPLFNPSQFRDVTADSVRRLLGREAPNCTVIEGFFPASDTQGAVRNVSFAHIDVDLHAAVRDCLNHLAPLALPRALFILDDARRGTPGVDLAVTEFLETHPDWLALPLYPSQTLLLKSGHP